MATEKGQNRLILLYAKKIKRLRGELEVAIARKKKAEVLLREFRWEAKNKKGSLTVEECNRFLHSGGLKKTAKYPDKIDKAIETMAAKVLKKATKKKTTLTKKEEMRIRDRDYYHRQ